MTPNGKAFEIVNRYFKEIDSINWHESKQCALIAVDEMLKVAFYANEEIYEFCMEVKQEIEKL